MTMILFSSGAVMENLLRDACLNVHIVAKFVRDRLAASETRRAMPVVQSVYKKFLQKETSFRAK